MIPPLTWIPFGQMMPVAGFPISGIHVLTNNSVDGRSALGVDTSLPVERGAPEPLINGEVAADYTLWTPPYRGEFLEWWSTGRPSGADTPLTEAFCRIAFANFELRILAGDTEDNLAVAIKMLYMSRQATLSRAGLSVKLNQLLQFAAYRQGTEQHMSAISSLRSLPGMPWGTTEMNMLLNGLYQACTPLNADYAILVGWAASTAEEQSVVIAGWQQLSPKFMAEFNKIYPAGLELTRPNATVPFVYEPSHLDVGRALPAGMRLGFDLPAFCSDRQLVPVLQVFRAVFGLKPVDGALGTIAPDSAKVDSEAHDSFKEVVVRKAKPKANAEESLTPAAKAVLDAGFLKKVEEEDQKSKSVLEKVIGNRPIDPSSSSALAASLRTALQTGNIPPEYALSVHVGPPEVLIAITTDIDAIASGASAVRILRGTNGAGKTHTLDVARIIAQMRGLAVGYAELTPGCRLHGNNGEVRALISSFMRSLTVNGESAGKGLRHLLEAIKSKCQVGPEPTPKEWLKAVQVVCEPLLDQPGGPEMVQVLAKYCAASQAGHLGMVASVQTWFRAEFPNPSEAKAALGLPFIVTDADLMRHVKLVTLLTQIVGATGLLLLVDELDVLTRNAYSGAQKANQDVLLNILNDASTGRLPGLGFIFAGSNDALDPDQRGLLASTALKSRLEGGGVILDVPTLIPQQLFRLMQKVRNHRLPESMLERLPDAALLEQLTKLLRPGWEKGLPVRDALKALSRVIERLEANPLLTWQDALQASQHQADQADGQNSSGTKSQHLKNLKL